MNKAREQKLFTQLEAQLNQQDTGWHARAIGRVAEFRNRMADKGDTLVVRIIAAEALRAELLRQLIDAPPILAGVDLDDMEYVLVGFGKAMAYLRLALDKDRAAKGLQPT